MRNYPYALAQGWAAQPIPEVLGAAWCEYSTPFLRRSRFLISEADKRE